MVVVGRTWEHKGPVLLGMTQIAWDPLHYSPSLDCAETNPNTTPGFEHLWEDSKELAGSTGAGADDVAVVAEQQTTGGADCSEIAADDAAAAALVDFAAAVPETDLYLAKAVPRLLHPVEESSCGMVRWHQSRPSY